MIIQMLQFIREISREMNAKKKKRSKTRQKKFRYYKTKTKKKKKKENYFTVEINCILSF